MTLKRIPPPPWAGRFAGAEWAVDGDGYFYYRSTAGLWIRVTPTGASAET